MREVVLPIIGTVSAWRREARSLAQTGIAPESVVWRVGQSEPNLFAGAQVSVRQKQTLTLPKMAIEELSAALCHSDPERFARAYSVALRLSQAELRWGDRSDPAMRTVLYQAKAVHRDIHKMHAFVRFREISSDTSRRCFAAWFEPEHPIVEAASPFFARRFGDMDWAIATPTITARFAGGQLTFHETDAVAPRPEDATEDLWRTYYASIFNPARLMVKPMQAEMPKRYWKNLPEASMIPELIQTAPERFHQMRTAAPTTPPARRTAAVRAAAALNAGRRPSRSGKQPDQETEDGQDDDK